MSQSPHDSTATNHASAGYHEAEKQLDRLIKAGFSFSGHEKNCAFLNTRDGRFANASGVSGFDFDDDGRGMALTDWDHDGDVDLWLSNRTGPRVRMLRNNTDNQHFLMLRLVGNTVNRDGIGARVEVTLPDRTVLVKTLRAGEGFLSQSSKWLHFGLGEWDHVSKVVVRWPGAEAESILRTCQAGHYEFRQGTAAMVPRKGRTERVELPLAAADKGNESGPFAVSLFSPIPMPTLQFPDMEGNSISTSNWQGRPILVNLWSTSCAPCLLELAELAAHRSQLANFQLEVAALCTDKLGDSTVDLAKAQAMLDKVHYAYHRGVATSNLLARLEVVQHYLFGPDRPLPIPASFLLDGQGRLVAIYHGRVTVERLMSDLQRLPWADTDRRDATLPFAGRWLLPPRHFRLLPLLATFLDAGFVSEATELIDRQAHELKDDPGFGHLLNRLGSSYVAQGDFNRGIEFYRAAQDVDPENADSYFNMGVVCARQGNAGEAEMAYRKALAIEPRHVEAWNNLGNLCMSNNRLDEAIECYQKSLSIDRQLFEVHYNLGMILVRKKQLGEATSAFQEALRIRPNSYLTLDKLGLIHLQNDDWSPAIDCFQRAIDLEPTFAPAYNNLATALVRRKEHDRALVLLRRAVELEPQGGDYRRNLAAVLAAKGQHDEAIHELASFMHLSPNDPKTYNAMTLLLRSIGKSEEAARILLEALKRPWDQLGHECRAEIADLLTTVGKSQEAMAEFRQLLQRKPSDGRVSERLGLTLMNLERLEEAVPHLQVAVASDPTAIPPQAALAWVLSVCSRDELRNPNLALQYALQVVATIGRQDARVLDILATAYAANGDFPTAIAVEQEALDLLRKSPRSDLPMTGLEERLALFESGRSFRMPPHTP